MMDLHKIKTRISRLWLSLRPRERFLISLLFFIGLAFALLQLGILRNIKEIKRKEERIATLQKELKSLGPLHKRYKLVKDKKEQANVGQIKDAQSIITEIDSYIQLAQLKPNVKYINGPTSVTIKETYKKKTVEIKVETVYINQALDFIYRVENSVNGLFIEYFFIRDAYNKPNYYDFTIRISQVLKS
jgi:hypothetical protein